MSSVIFILLLAEGGFTFRDGCNVMMHKFAHQLVYPSYMAEVAILVLVPPLQNIGTTRNCSNPYP